MNNDSYNTYDGIRDSLFSMVKFNEMLDERRRAGYERKEHLNSFVVLGRFLLDSCGNVGYATDFIAAEKIPDFPQVLSKDAFNRHIELWQKKEQPDVLTRAEIDVPNFDYAANKRPWPISVSFGMRNNIPRANLRCPHCGNGWTVKTCHDTVGVKDKWHEEICPYKGKTLTEVRKELKKKSDGIYYVHNFIYKEGQKKNPENGRLETIDIQNDYVFEKNDTYHYEKHFKFHKKCYIERAKKKCEIHRINKGKDYLQGNLAGDIACNEYVKLELDLAGIDIVEDKKRGEVPTSFIGKLGDFEFSRAWYYWIVVGDIPLNLAKEMYYGSEEGKKSVRVSGHCGCPAPEGWAHNGVVNCYHIDTWRGLKLFADTVRKLVPKK